MKKEGEKKRKDGGGVGKEGPGVCVGRGALGFTLTRYVRIHYPVEAFLQSSHLSGLKGLAEIDASGRIREISVG